MTTWYTNDMGTNYKVIATGTDAGRTCDWCGTFIKNTVTVQDDAGAKLTIGFDCAAAIGVERHTVAAYERALRNQATQGTKEIETIRTWVAEADKLGAFRPATFEYVAETLAALEAGAHVPQRTFRRVVGIAGDAPKPRKTEPITFLFTLDGEHVPAKAVGTQYGMKWLIESVDGENAWVPYMPARPSTLTKYGYMEVEGLAWVDDDVPQLNPPIEVAC